MAIPGMPRPRTPDATDEAGPSVDGSLLSSDWPALATQQVVKVVDQVRDKTTNQAITASRAVVYGLVIAVAAAVVGVLLLIGTIRLLDVVLPRGVWLVYVLLGTVFTAAGAICWTKRTTAPAR